MVMRTFLVLIAVAPTTGGSVLLRLVAAVAILAATSLRVMFCS